MDDIIEVIKSLEDSSVLIDEVTKTVKHEIKKRRGFFWALLANLVASLVQPVIFSLVKGKSGKVARRTRRGYRDEYF